MGNVSVRSLVSEPFSFFRACNSTSLRPPPAPSFFPHFYLSRLFSSSFRPHLATVPTRLFFQPILLCPGSGLFHFCLPPHFSCRSELRQCRSGNINNPAGPCETLPGLGRITAKSCDKNGGDESDRLNGLTPAFFFSASRGGGSCFRLFHSSSLPFFHPFFPTLSSAPPHPPALPAMLSQSHPTPFICLLSPPSLSSQRCRLEAEAVQ